MGAADGRTMARVMIAFANKSSHDASRRIQRKHLELARQGKSSGGQAPYGWQEDGRKVDPVAAEHIRIAQKQLLAGQIRGLGHPREGTTRLPHHLVERMLTDPRLCGYRTYRGEVLLDDDGHPLIGVWEPINIVPHASRGRVDGAWSAAGRRARVDVVQAADDRRGRRIRRRGDLDEKGDIDHFPMPEFRLERMPITHEVIRAALRRIALER